MAQHSETDDELWERVELSNFARDLLSARKWFEAANELESALDILEPHVLAWWQSMREWSRKNAPIWREHGYAGLYLMLSAYVLENLCKGFLASKLSSADRELVRSKGKLPKILDSHDTLELVQKVGLDVSETDQALLQKLSRAATWFGRYPVSRFYRDRNRARLPSGKLHTTSWQGSSEVYQVRRLIREVRSRVNARRSYRSQHDA